jgi:hypothetical protein
MERVLGIILAEEDGSSLLLEAKASKVPPKVGPDNFRAVWSLRILLFCPRA